MGSCLKLEKSHCKNVQWKYTDNESRKSYFGNNERKAMFLVVSQLDVNFDFACPFFVRPIGHACKIARLRNGQQ